MKRVYREQSKQDEHYLQDTSNTNKIFKIIMR
jgi:hypothetical protein